MYENNSDFNFGLVRATTGGTEHRTLIFKAKRVSRKPSF